MAELTMTLAEALNKRKLMKKKIDKKIKLMKKSTLVIRKDSADNKSDVYKEFENKMKSECKSLETLCTNYSILTEAIAKANAKTKTELVGSDKETKLTIAQAIMLYPSGKTIDNDIYNSLQSSYDESVDIIANSPLDLDIIDPLRDVRKQLKVINHDAEYINQAIMRASNKTKIKVNFID